MVLVVGDKVAWQLCSFVENIRRKAAPFGAAFRCKKSLGRSSDNAFDVLNEFPSKSAKVTGPRAANICVALSRKSREEAGTTLTAKARS